MTNWRWDNSCTFVDQVDHSNAQTTSSRKITCTGECFSRYGSDAVRAQIEPLSCRKYKHGDFLAVRQMIWDEILDDDDDDDNCADSGGPRAERSRPSDGNDMQDSEGEEDTQGG